MPRKTYKLVVILDSVFPELTLSEEFDEEDLARQCIEDDADKRHVPFESIKYLIIERVNYVDHRIKASHPGLKEGIDEADVWYYICTKEDDSEGHPIYVKDDDDCG